MKAKFVWNGQVIEQELRRMDDPPDTMGEVMLIRQWSAISAWHGAHTPGWFIGEVMMAPHQIRNIIGWCEMPKLMEVVE